MSANNNDANPQRDALMKTYSNELREIKKKAEILSLTADAEEDYDRARKNLHNLIELSTESLAAAASLARDSEHPRAFEVLANMIGTASQLSDQLLKLQKQRHELADKNKEKPSNANTTNNIFVGSTSDLQRMLNKREEKIIEVEQNADSEA